MSATRNAPVLCTARLTLRGPVPADFDGSVALWQEPAVVRHIGGRPFGAEEVWTRLLRYAGLWSLLGFGYWTVLDTASGRLVGEIGFADYRRDMRPALGEAPECGWVLATWAHGRGYATEALAAVLAWADTTLDHPRTVCFIDPTNAASLRVAERVGYRRCGEGVYRDSMFTVFERFRA